MEGEEAGKREKGKAGG